ncbi:putative GAG protein [Labeo rohita]|uniref:Putative GAG protein n=1 Tax=Labeo rohita TaxID=84645 RepID=A0A498MGG9_LABRO|nr:putative GAG protein [Labeo rohita]
MPPRVLEWRLRVAASSKDDPVLSAVPFSAKGAQTPPLSWGDIMDSESSEFTLLFDQQLLAEGDEIKGDEEEDREMLAHLLRELPALPTCIAEMKCSWDKPFSHRVPVKGYSSLDVSEMEGLGLSNPPTVEQSVAHHLYSNRLATLSSVSPSPPGKMERFTASMYQKIYKSSAQVVRALNVKLLFMAYQAEFLEELGMQLDAAESSFSHPRQSKRKWIISPSDSPSLAKGGCGWQRLSSSFGESPGNSHCIGTCCCKQVGKFFTPIRNESVFGAGP